MKKKRKIWIIFDIQEWLWKTEFSNFAGLITSTENNFNAIYMISGVLASLWKVFIKFLWHGEKFTMGFILF